NGHLTFEAPWSSYSPEKFPMDEGRDIIAPFWADLDNRKSGNIYYVQYTNGSILQQVTQDINVYFPELTFNASWIFIATWHKIPYILMPETQTTFQAVLASNGNYSFVILNYGSLAGYDTAYSCHNFTMLGSFSQKAIPKITLLGLGSNVKISGRWAFRVDLGSRDCNGPLYPIGGTTSSREDDGSSTQISLLQSFNYFGKSYSQIYVCSPYFLDFKSLSFLLLRLYSNIYPKQVNSQHYLI
uniref:Sushi, nidogen and EGF-like domain-containing protein 1 n=1 Tax=Cyprinodon variegatus TaxID=28743 RepID=A0A3Q2FHK9_CYPVA